MRGEAASLEARNSALQKMLTTLDAAIAAVGAGASPGGGDAQQQQQQQQQAGAAGAPPPRGGGPAAGADAAPLRRPSSGSDLAAMPMSDVVAAQLQRIV